MTAMSRRLEPRRALRRLRLFFRAWRLHPAAQLVAVDSWDETRERLLAAGPTPARSAPADAIRAAAWAARVGRRLMGRRDTCLIRSLIAGALVADLDDVAVRVGVYRPWSSGDLLDAHAWLTVAGREVPASREPAGDRFEEVVVMPLGRAR